METNNWPMTPEALAKMTLGEIADVIYRDHRKNRQMVHFAAAPYVSAMQSLRDIGDHYGLDSGMEIVTRALCNLSTWRGDVARAVKKELNKRLKRG